MLILLALLGCTDAYPTASTTTDTSSEMEMDTGSDSDTDTGADDTGVDSGSDDTSGDTAVDDSDTAADTADSGSDTGTEDTATDSGSDVDSGTDSGSEEDSGSDGCDDADSDGYCSTASGGSDCDDRASAVNPGQAEVPDNGVDEDCDGVVETTEVVEDTGSEDTGTEDTGSGDTAEDTGTADTDTGSEDTGVEYVDADSDGYGSTATGGDDCDDANSGISPGAVEIADDGIDQDCSGADSVTPEADVDGDGYGVSEDCDDSNDAVYPGADEVCDWIADNNCDGVDDTDEVDDDGDGFTHCFMYHTQVDDDGDGYCDGGVDNNRDGDCTDSGDVIYAEDETAPSEYIDCDLTDASVYPGATEVLDDGVDQDCDGSDSTLATLQDEAMCSGTSQEACVVDVDGDGVLETLLMDDSQWTSSSRYGDDAEVVEYGSCAINGDTVSTNSVGYYVIDFTGLSSCTTQMSLVQSSYSYWWQNLSFCTDGSDIQGICENMSGANYLIGLDWDSSDGFQL